MQFNDVWQPRGLMCPAAVSQDEKIGIRRSTLVPWLGMEVLAPRCETRLTIQVLRRNSWEAMWPR